MKYNLFGVSNHLMFTKSVGGHYTSYITINTQKQETDQLTKTMGKDAWFEFDDDTVTPMPTDEVVNKNAFLLFFKRKEFKASTIQNLLVTK
jgi:ubiquitin C-terminal hydrolase